jgi:hypothetical protein
MQPTGHPAAMPAHSLADPSKGGRDRPDHLVAFSWNRWSPSLECALATRQVKAALSAMVVKTDRKDARGIAQL